MSIRKDFFICLYTKWIDKKLTPDDAHSNEINLLLLLYTLPNLDLCKNNALPPEAKIFQQNISPFCWRSKQTRVESRFIHFRQNNESKGSFELYLIEMLPNVPVFLGVVYMLLLMRLLWQLLTLFKWEYNDEGKYIINNKELEENLTKIRSQKRKKKKKEKNSNNMQNVGKHFHKQWRRHTQNSHGHLLRYVITLDLLHCPNFLTCINSFQ